MMVQLNLQKSGLKINPETTNFFFSQSNFTPKPFVKLPTNYIKKSLLNSQTKLRQGIIAQSIMQDSILFASSA